MSLAWKKNGHPDIAHASGRISRLSICTRRLSSIRLRLSNTRPLLTMPPWLTPLQIMDMLFLSKQVSRNICLSSLKQKASYGILPTRIGTIKQFPTSHLHLHILRSFDFLLFYFVLSRSSHFTWTVSLVLSKIPNHRSLFFSFVGHLLSQWSLFSFSFARGLLFFQGYPLPLAFAYFQSKIPRPLALFLLSCCSI